MSAYLLRFKNKKKPLIPETNHLGSYSVCNGLHKQPVFALTKSIIPKQDSEIDICSFRLRHNLKGCVCCTHEKQYVTSVTYSA